MMKQPPSDEAIDSLTDRELIARFVASRNEVFFRQNEVFFRQLVVRHGALVWGVSQRILRSHQDREDVFQATFLKLLQHLQKRPWQATVGAWLHRVAYHLALKTIERRKRRRELSLMHEPVLARCQFEAIQQQDVEVALHAAILELPKLDQEAVVAYYIKGRTLSAGAFEIGSTPAAVKSQLQRARRVLVARLGRRGVSLSIALVVLQQTAQAAPQSLPPQLIEHTMLMGAHQLGAGGAIHSVSPVKHGLTQGNVLSMDHSILAAQILTSVGCYAAMCLGG